MEWLSKYLRLAVDEDICHSPNFGKEWFEYRGRTSPEFMRRIEEHASPFALARESHYETCGELTWPA